MTKMHKLGYLHGSENTSTVVSNSESENVAWYACGYNCMCKWVHEYM